MDPLRSAINPSADASALEGKAHVVFSEPGPWVFELPSDFVKHLGALPRDWFLPVAERRVKSPELSHARRRGPDVVPAIESLKEMASIAIQKEKALLLWMSLGSEAGQPACENLIRSASQKQVGWVERAAIPINRGLPR
jgi:hypothetical protein